MNKSYPIPPPGTATEATRRANAAVAKSLPLGDQTDFEKARRGLIATLDGPITTDDGRTIIAPGAQAPPGQPAPETVNPSLWRQAQLNAVHGLFQLAEGVYQLRGYDIALMTLIRGRSGWIVVDCLNSAESARAGFDLAMKHLERLPLSAVLITHSHADHYGGVGAILTEENLAGRDVPIIVPEGFTKASVSEAVLGGNLMARRAMYQFGVLLPVDPTGAVDGGIGPAATRGSRGFALPTQEIRETGEKLTIDGVDFVFQIASGTEAPAEFTFYLPQHKALCMSEVTCRTMHNILALRGVQVRDSLLWANCIDEAIRLFGDDVELYFACHSWPEWGNSNIRTFLEEQRDIYRFIHDQSLRLANMGHTPNEIVELVKEPDFMQRSFSVRGYYGTLNHNMKATYQKYFGYFDGNPANLDPLPPVAAGKRYVEAIGGQDAVLDLAWRAFEEGEYRWAVTLINHLVFADPSCEAARSMLAATYEQLGFQSESILWRNIYLCGAKELRDGVKPRPGAGGVNAEIVRAMPTEDFFNLLATKLDPEKARSKRLVINFELTGSSEQICVTVANQVENHRLDSRSERADVSVHLTRNALNEIAYGRASLDDAIADGTLRVEGRKQVLQEYLDLHDSFDLWFNIVEP